MDESAWVGVAFVLFVGLLGYMGVFGKLTAALDDRAAKIKAQLEEAQRLRDEAQKLFAEYQQKQQAALKEAEDIVAHAQEEAKRIAAKAEADLNASLGRRQAMAEQKIAQAESQAILEVRAAAVDVAVAAARKVLTDRMKGDAANTATDNAIADVRALMH